MTLLDEAMPEWHFNELHHADLGVGPERAHAALLVLDARDILLTRVLLNLRELPARVRGGQPEIKGALVDAMEATGFRRLAHEPGEEIVWGIVGRFWHPWQNLDAAQPSDLDAFRGYAEPGHAKAGWNFRFDALPGGRTRVTTETRICATDDAARHSFGRYWLLIRPGSGLIRRDLLRALRRRAERDH